MFFVFCFFLIGGTNSEAVLVLTWEKPTILFFGIDGVSLVWKNKSEKSRVRSYKCLTEKFTFP